MSAPAKPKYRTTNWKEYNTALKARGSLLIWMDKDMRWHYRRQWRKVHLGIDAVTLEIRAIEVTDNATGDAPMLACLLDQIPADETIASVSGDGAYDTKGCHEAIAQPGAQALIPTRKNAKPWRGQRCGCQRPQRRPGCHAPAWQENLEEVERLSPAQPCRQLPQIDLDP